MSNRTSKHFTMHSGNDRRVLVPVVDQRGDPVDISGAEEITWIISKSAGSSPVVTKTLTGGGVMITNNSTFKFDIVSDDTSGRTGHYYHEAQVVNSDGKIYTPIHGSIRILPTSI